MNQDKAGLPPREELPPAKVRYTLRVLDDDWEEETPLRCFDLDSQGAIEMILCYLDQDEADAKETRVIPGATIPSRCYLLEGYLHA